MNNVEDFKDAIRAHSLIPPSVFTPGKLHRIDRADKPKEHKPGWCLLFDDCNSGVISDFSLDISETWQAKNDRPLTPEEKQDFMRRADESRRQAETARKEKSDQAAQEKRPDRDLAGNKCSQKKRSQKPYRQLFWCG